MDLFDISLYASYLLVIVAGLAALLLPLINSFGDPKQLVKGLIGIGILLVVFFVGYVLSGSEITAVYIKNGVDNATASKLIGGSLIAMYIFFIVGFASVLVTEVIKLFK